MVASTSSPLAAIRLEETEMSGCPASTRWPCSTWMAVIVPG
jgi:hypothetical protein